MLLRRCDIVVTRQVGQVGREVLKVVKGAKRRRVGLGGIGAALHALEVVLRGESLYERSDPAIEHAVDVVDREPDAVICDAALGEVVGPDLLGPIAGGDERAPLGGALRLLSLPLLSVDAGA